jgi:hypothetical protein
LPNSHDQELTQLPHFVIEVVLVCQPAKNKYAGYTIRNPQLWHFAIAGGIQSSSRLLF